ncbi:hypothetical protein [Nonomuraea sp. SYSU D8015]|uniref:hypothetical protein n=1 Tax=Nonomuraea sp. SYSU D8015 TaxID=2593644 RepID=UPI0016613F80|nr:hypothetical protein [Nonomuraea sp. SYSU D8015]
MNASNSQSEPQDVTTAAARIATAWHRTHGGSTIAIPVGVVAALALLKRGPEPADLVRDQIGALATVEADQLVEVLQAIWANLWVHQPYIVEIARPLHTWLNDDEPLSPATCRAVHDVIRVALEAGLFRYTSTTDVRLRCQEDVLGTVLNAFRTDEDRARLGEYAPPAYLTDLQVRLLGAPESIAPGQRIIDTAAHTGATMRAFALALREQGGDPADHCWFMCESDALAAACAAVNALIWDLGPDVLIFVGDYLQAEDPYMPAVRHRNEVWMHAMRVRDLGALASIWRRDRWTAREQP